MYFTAKGDATDHLVEGYTGVPLWWVPLKISGTPHSGTRWILLKKPDKKQPQMGGFHLLGAPQKIHKKSAENVDPEPLRFDTK